MGESLVLLLFGIVVAVMLALDLGVFQRRAHFPTMKEALAWSAVWIALAVGFDVFIFLRFGHVKGLEFITGYLVEEALSVDNIFVFVLIFTYFAVPAGLQHRVLFWGVLSAVVLRGIFIVAGAALVAQFHWILYLFGIFLIFTAGKLVLQDEMQVEPEKNPFIRYCRKFFPITEGYEGSNFFIRRDSRRFITPLFLVLVMIETTDIAFATDSIPAIFAITRDPIIIYTSNIFAILGLRTLYFVLAGLMKKLRYLKAGLSVVLAFIGVKMLIEPWLKISIGVSLVVIFLVLAVTVIVSILSDRKDAGKAS